MRASSARGSPASAQATDVREVVVADADRIGVAERGAHHLGRSPRADADERREASRCLAALADASSHGARAAA